VIPINTTIQTEPGERDWQDSLAETGISQ